MEISLTGRIILYAVIVPFALVSAALWFYQLMIFRGKTFRNPDGSRDGWEHQRLCYGTALGDMIYSIPLTLIATVLIFLGWRLGFYLMGLAASWCVYINIVTTSTSIRFENPKESFLLWFLTYPFWILLGAAYIAWSLYYFPVLFGTFH